MGDNLLATARAIANADILRTHPAVAPRWQRPVYFDILTRYMVVFAHWQLEIVRNALCVCACVCARVCVCLCVCVFVAKEANIALLLFLLFLFV